MKFRDVRKMLKTDGWNLVAQNGSHEQWKHPIKTGRVTVAGKDNDDVAVGTLKSIFRQSGLEVK